jgi:hypothetical protein
MPPFPEARRWGCWCGYDGHREDPQRLELFEKPGFFERGDCGRGDGLIIKIG